MPRHKEDDGVRKRGEGRAALASIALGSALAVLLVLPVFSTLQPGYYGRYSDLRVRMDHWRASTHAKVSCIDCHVEPGASDFVKFGALSIPAFYSQLIAGPKATNLLPAPDKRACQKCHTDYRQVSPNGDLLIPHRAHVEVLHINCVVCHKNLVHTANTAGFNKPEMTTCINLCHDGHKATDKCDKCHTRKQTPESHSKPDWLLIHGAMSKTIDCGKCHNWTPNYCGDCHKKRPPTHVGNWKKGHSAEAKQRGDGCLVCHSMAKFCKNCH
ncbi:MAG TPA: hypothetical protein VGK50_04105 [Coriobacteriia bacterium]